MRKNRMNIRNTGNHITRRIRLIAGTSALATAFVVALPQAGHAQTVTPPPAPDRLHVPDGNEAYLIGHAFGSQDYVCAASGSGVAFVLTTPEAVLFNNPAHRIINHFFSANPFEAGAVRATWQSTRNSSAFWGALVRAATFTSDPEFVAKDAIAWLLLSRAGVLEGSGNGDNLAEATFVQRVNTVGGLAPSIGCNSPDNLGTTAFVPYEADYVFYRSTTATTAVAERK
jgi:hypothetical protein